MNPLNLDQAEIEKQLTQNFDLLISIITTYGLKVVGAIIILIVGWIAAGMFSRAILRAFGRFCRVDQTVVAFTAFAARP